MTALRRVISAMFLPPYRARTNGFDSWKKFDLSRKLIFRVWAFLFLICPCECASAVSHHDFEAGQKVGGGTHLSNYGSRLDRRNGYLRPNLVVFILFALRHDVLAVNAVREVHHPVEADRVILQIRRDVFDATTALAHEYLSPDPHHVSKHLRKLVLLLRRHGGVLLQGGRAKRQHQLDGVRVHLSCVLVWSGRCIWILLDVFD